MDSNSLIKINRFIKEMPPLSVSVTKIMELSRDPAVDAKKLNDVISIDPVLTGKVLKLINSAYYSMPNQVTSLVRAVVMLGVNTIKNLVISTGVISNINTGTNFVALDMESFWRHSLCVGAMAKFFASKQKVDVKFIEEYFVAGLLHDIGKIPFNTVIPEEYKKVIDYSVEHKIPLHNVETKHFEINHCDLGLRIAEMWKLPATLKDTISCHHNLQDVSSQTRKFVATVCLANILASRAGIGFSGNGTPDTNEEELLSITALKWDDIREAEKNVESTIKKAEIFLKLT